MADSVVVDNGWCYSGTTPIYSFTVDDHADTALADDDIDTLTLTLKHVQSGLVIRNAVDALNDNDCTIDANGLFTWYLQPTDTVITNAKTASGQGDEYHAVVIWTWTDGLSNVHIMKRELTYRVRKAF